MSSDWCAQIRGGTRINQLALPGTHDAAAWTELGNEASVPPGTWAQRRSITAQLNLGVRVLDLRVGWGLVGSVIGMYHGPIYVGSTLQEVLTDIRNWLLQHDQEFVVLIFQQQGAWTGTDLANNVRTMVHNTFGMGADVYNFNPHQQQWPTLDEMRGKVLVMGRLQSDVAGFCNARAWLTDGNNTDGTVIPAGNNLRLYLQDRYSRLSTQEGYQNRARDNALKFERVRAAARAIPPNVTSTNLLRINHLSYSNLRYQPWESGEGVNTLLRNSQFAITGVLMMDDADQATVDHVLANNAPFRVMRRRASSI